MSTQKEIHERPILMSSPMVNAILEGRKTQTRRIHRFQPNYGPYASQKWTCGLCDDGESWQFNSPLTPDGFTSKCPYGKPGDRLWVRETWAKWTDGQCPECCVYRADGDKRDENFGPWRPSIHMPRWASRITLEIESVRVERLQDISAKDIVAEGVVLRSHDCPAFAAVGANPKCPVSAFDNAAYPDLRSLWASGWEQINGKGSWAANPWVWVISFCVLGRAER